MLDQAVGLGLLDPLGARDVAGDVEFELRLEALDLERSDPATVGERGRCAACVFKRLCGDLRRAVTVREDAIELVVVESRIRANPAAVELRPTRLPVRREPHLHRYGEPLHLRRERARFGAERRRKHGLDGARDVGAGAAFVGHPFETAAGPNVGRDVGYVDPEPRPVAVGLSRDRVVEVARGRRVDGERVERGEITPPAARCSGSSRFRGRCRLGLELVGEASLEPALPQERRDDVGRPLWRAEITKRSCASRSELGKDHTAVGRLGRAAHQCGARAWLEQGFHRAKPPSLGDDADPPVAVVRPRCSSRSQQGPQLGQPNVEGLVRVALGIVARIHLGLHSLPRERLALGGDVLADR